MKYSFEEKKKRICVTATVIFVIIAGIVYIYSGRFFDEKQLSEFNLSDKVVIESDAFWEDTEDVDRDSVSSQEKVKNVDTVSDKGDDNQSKANCCVHICGAVKMPGVYEINNGARIMDAIEAAGGFKKSAAEDYLNLAETVIDGQKIFVPTRKAVRNKETDTEGVVAGKDDLQESSDDKVNINTADAEELMSLPGIGQSKAENIISYRQENGNYTSIEDLMNIPGIKEGVFSKISDHIKVN